MTYTIIILGIVAIIANALMDEVDHRWVRIFKYLVPKKSKFEKFVNPRISWHNKKSKNKIIQFLLSTVFVMFTDFWHLMKFIFLNCIFSIIILISGIDWWFLLIMNFGWGIIFELFFTGLFGMIGDKLKYK